MDDVYPANETQLEKMREQFSAPASDFRRVFYTDNKGQRQEHLIVVHRDLLKSTLRCLSATGADFFKVYCYETGEERDGPE